MFLAAYIKPVFFLPVMKMINMAFKFENGTVPFKFSYNTIMYNMCNNLRNIEL